MTTVIVGAGIMGLSAAWALTRRGEKVIIVDQSDIPNPAGSSVDDHRLIRYPYGSSEGYCRMVGQAFAAWSDLWSDLGTTLYAETGTLVLGKTDDQWPGESRAVLQRLGIPFEDLLPATAADRFPHLDMSDCRDILYLASGGTLMARHIIGALAHWLAAHGAELHTRAKAKAIDFGKASLTLDGGKTLQGDNLILAAGPWTGDMIPAMGSRAVPSRQIVIYADPPAELQAAWAMSPMVLEIGHSSGFYAVPPRVAPDGRMLGLKFGDHSFSLTGHPDRNRAPGKDEQDALFAMCRPRLAMADRYRIVEAKTCFYDVSSEERFIIEPAGRNALVMTGFSGHGFKFGPFLGLGLAEVVLDGADMQTFSRMAAGHGA